MIHETSKCFRTGGWTNVLELSGGWPIGGAGVPLSLVKGEKIALKPYFYKFSISNT